MSGHLGKRLSALIDGELGDSDRERVLAHLAWCETCREEAAALRVVKQRMRALGGATAGDALNRRLIALAALYGGPLPRPRPSVRRYRWRAAGRRPPSRAHRRRRAWSWVAACVVVVGFGIPAAAFLAGGGQRPQGPRVTPAVDVFMVQHAITTGEVPVRPVSPAVPASPGAGPSRP